MTDEAKKVQTRLLLCEEILADILAHLKVDTRDLPEEIQTKIAIYLELLGWPRV